MSVIDDRDWRDLSAAWRSERSPFADPDALRRAVRRRSRWMTAIAVGEALVTLGLVALTLWVTGRGAGFFETVWLAGLWFFWAIAAVFAVWNRRGVWRPVASSTRAYLELSLERCRRRVREARFIHLLLAGEVLFLIWLAIWQRGTASLVPFGLVLGAVVVMVSGAAWVYERRARREARELERLRSELSAAAGEGEESG